MPKCLNCGKDLRVKKVKELTRGYNIVRTTKLYECVFCDEMPYFFNEDIIKIDVVELKFDGGGQ